MVLSPEELDAIYVFAIQLARDAGDMLMSGVTSRREGASLEIDIKENAVDIVTKTDKGKPGTPYGCRVSSH